VVLPIEGVQAINYRKNPEAAQAQDLYQVAIHEVLIRI
jgi:hypothetical protein